MGLSSVDLPLGDLVLSRLYWGRSHRQQGGSDDENVEEARLYVDDPILLYLKENAESGGISGVFEASDCLVDHCVGEGCSTYIH